MNLRQRIQAHHAEKNEIKAAKEKKPEAPKTETLKKKGK